MDVFNLIEDASVLNQLFPFKIVSDFLLKASYMILSHTAPPQANLLLISVIYLEGQSIFDFHVIAAFCLDLRPIP